MSLSFFKKPKRIGLDIGHSNIKIAQVEPTSTGYRIHALHSIPTPRNAVQDSVVVDIEATADAIKQLLRKARTDANTAHLAVAGPTVVVRTVKMPQMPEAALRKSLRFEAARYVPSSVEDSYIECEIIGNSNDGQMDVLIVASPKDMVEGRVAAAEAAGLEVDIVDIEAFACYRAFVEADTDFQPNAPFVLVDIGGQVSDVSVIDGGKFALTRSIPLAGEALTNALQSYFKLSYEEATQGKLVLDLRPLIDAQGPMENPPLRVVQPLIDELIREIRRSINYFQSQQADARDKKPTQLILTGGSSQMTGLPEYLSHKLGLQVLTPNFFMNPHFAFEEPSEDIEQSAFGVALGLAMHKSQKLAAVA